MRYLVIALVALLPIHALLVTLFKCKFGVNTDILRFWKEILVMVLFVFTVFTTLKSYKWNVEKLYKNNYILGTATAFALCSFLYIFFPFLQIKLSGFLGFKYDVFFILCLVIGLYFGYVKKHFEQLLQIAFGVAITMLFIFLPWYAFGDISAVTNIFGFSSEVSTYNANSCISFSQNVNGEHRFQGSFAGPIRWSVFLTVIFFLYLGYIKDCFSDKTAFSKKWFLQRKSLLYPLITIPSILVVTSVFFSYSKTSVLGLALGVILFMYYNYTLVSRKQISQKIYIVFAAFAAFPILLVAFIKRDLFLHLGSLINRMDNLSSSFVSFNYNPLGQGLGFAGPASSIGNSIESAGELGIALVSTGMTHKFLPENWYVQILLEQGIWGLGLFIGFLASVWVALYTIMLKKRDSFSVGIFVAFVTLLFMANFTHAFEESATSYTLFLLIGGYVASNNAIKYKKKK